VGRTDAIGDYSFLFFLLHRYDMICATASSVCRDFQNPYSHKSERVGPSGNFSKLYSEGANFESRQDAGYLHQGFRRLPQSLQANTSIVR
jgi:hypothetical protein